MKSIPSAEQTIEISENVISRWHKEENRISSLEDAVKIISDKKYTGLLKSIQLLSIMNTTLWHEEDKARDNRSNDSIIADIKRKIDRLNATRVNMVEEIDDILYRSIKFNADAPLNTETPGSVIDRLTILSLKKYHMAVEAERNDSSAEHRAKCAEKFELICKQINDLAEAYNSLIHEIENGRRRYAMYRQFKMYNDPDLNPVLYGKK